MYRGVDLEALERGYEYWEVLAQNIDPCFLLPQETKILSSRPLDLRVISPLYLYLTQLWTSKSLLLSS
jgi:hypothetical protein